MMAITATVAAANTAITAPTTTAAPVASVPPIGRKAAERRSLPGGEFSHHGVLTSASAAGRDRLCWCAGSRRQLKMI